MGTSVNIAYVVISHIPRMRSTKIIIFLSFLFSSCENNENKKPEGSWRLNYNEKIENPFIPFEIQFYGDSIKLVDGNNFCHTGYFTKQEDTLTIEFSNGSKSKVPLEIITDSTIKFASEDFYLIDRDEFTKVLDYELLGFETGNTLVNSSKASVIHLIKLNDEPKVILNDIISNLNEIPFLLSNGHGTPSSLLIYIGRGVLFEELVETYCWINVSGIQNVTLIVANKGFDHFFFQRDEISIGDSLMHEFLHKNNIPPSPPSKKSIEDKKVQIIRANKLELEELNDSMSYLIKIDTKFNIIDFLKLKGVVEKKKNVRIEIEQLTTSAEYP